MKVPFEVFRAYDIRGLVGSQLTDELAFHLGRAYGTYLRREGAGSCTVGYDARETGPSYAKHLIQGLVDSGVQAIEIGLVSTPMSYYTVWTGIADAGVMITASHNPPEFNGFKMTLRREKLTSEGYQELRRLIEAEDYETGTGQHDRRSIDEEYKASCLERLERGRALKIVVDTGNGTGGIVLPSMLRALGHEVIELFTEPDGTFPNHHPDPSVAENLVDLQKAVLDHGADLGLAVDGDADRAAAVDEKGETHHTDEIVALFARELLAHTKGPIVFDVKCSKLVRDTIEAGGGEPVECRTGHTFVTEVVAEHKALLGGEMSGHLYFNDRYYGYDDGLYGTCRIAELISQRDEPLSVLIPENSYDSTPEVKVPVADSEKFAIIDEVTAATKRLEPLTIDGVKAYVDDGWFLIRASNTSPYLVVRCEAKSEEGLAARKKQVQEVLNPILEEHGAQKVVF